MAGGFSASMEKLGLARETSESTFQEREKSFGHSAF
jgi:hypothetical protein